MKIKIIQVKANTPEERKNKIEEVQNLNELIQCKGSIYFQVDNLFYADVYFVQGQTILNEPQIKAETHQIKEKIENKPFNPTKEQLARWKMISPTKKTKELLIKKGFTDLEIKNIKTQEQANIILNNLKKENI